MLFQTSDAKLRKKVLAEDLVLEDMVKFGLAYEQTQAKADQMAGSSSNREENDSVRRVVKEEVRRLNPSPRGGGGDKVKCQTCTGSHKTGFVCPAPE